MTPDLMKLNDSDLGRAAASYMWFGFPVFPCRPGGKEPDTRHGFKDAAVAAPDRLPRIAEVWDQNRWNVGLPTGSLYDVLDVDVRDAKPGRFNLRKLEVAGMLDGAVAHATTPSGGMHLYFPASGSRSGALPDHGLDFKALGGYVIAPPSEVMLIDSDGVVSVPRYEWTWARPVGEGEPFDWQRARDLLGARTADRLHRPVRTGIPVEDVVEGLARWLVSQPNNRNSALYWAASRAVEEGACTSEHLRPLVEASLKLSQQGEYRTEEAWKTAKSALSRG